MINRTAEFKRNFPTLTANTPLEKLEELVGMMDETSYSKGKTIIQDGLNQNSLFFVMDGILNAFIIEKGQRLELGETLPGNIAGEISVFGNSTATATIEAKTDCKLLTLDKADLKYLQESTPEILGQLLRLTAKTIANRIVISDKLVYQKFCDEAIKEENNLQMLLSWCSGLYQQIHGYERKER